VLPKLVKLDGTPITDYSWTCPTRDSCWMKFHNFYQQYGLFNNKGINIYDSTMKFGSICYASDLYKKNTALGIDVEVDGENKHRKNMVKIDIRLPMGNN
jgi:hypothetical protein